MNEYAESVMRLDWIADSGVDRRLLPGMLRRRDNARRRRHMKSALSWGLRQLGPEQREQLRLFYAGGLNQTEIAKRQGVSASWASRSIRDGEEKLRAFAELYMEIYDKLEKEFLSDE